MAIRNCRVTPDCDFEAKFLCECTPEAYICLNCLKYHIGICQGIELGDERKIHELSDREQRNQTCSVINELLANDQLHRYYNESNLLIALIKNELMAKHKVSSELETNAISTVESLNNPVEGEIIKINKNISCFLHELLSRNLRDRIEYEFSLEIMVISKREFFEKERTISELTEQYSERTRQAEEEIQLLNQIVAEKDIEIQGLRKEP